MQQARFLISSLAAALLLNAAPAGAQAVNVSRLVLGGTNNQTQPQGSATPIPCQSCSYATVYAAGMNAGYSSQVGPLLANGWPPQHGVTLAGAASVLDNVGIGVVPTGRVADGGIVGAEQRARTRLDKSQFTANPVREVAVQSWRSGSGLAVASHSVTITTPAAASGSVPTYVTLAIPRHRRGIQNAYAVSSTTGDYYYERPQRMQAGSAVDVYVDGLPVWSASSQVLVPGRYTPPLATNQLYLRWGETLSTIAESTVTLFLGYLPSGSTRNLTMVMRSEAHLDAEDCKYTSSQGQALWRCHSQVEALTLPAVWSGSSSTGMRPAIDVFTR